MQVAVIGLGEIAKKGYLPVLTAWEGTDLLFMSRSSETVRCLQEQYRVSHGTNNLDDVLRAKPKASFVLSPSETHFEIAQALLEGGIDVFLEKPATLHSEQTRQLAELADRKDRVLMVGFNRRYAPLHQQAREVWGDHTTSIAQFQKYRSNASHPSLAHQFTDDTIHQIDMLRYFCGEGEVVSTAHQVHEGRLYGAISTVALERGGFAQVVTSLRAGRWQEVYAIHGDQLSMQIEAFSELQILEKGNTRVWKETYASSWKTTLEGRGFAGQIAHFFDCVRDRTQPKTDGWDSVKTQRLMEAMVAKAAGANSI